MRTLLLGICIIIASTTLAQSKCASSAYIDYQKSLDPFFADRINQIEKFINQAPARLSVASKEDGSIVIHIPVVVHVLYSNAPQNISDLQVKSQIDALNRDFRRQNADTVNTPQRFRSRAADVAIEFELATADAKGRATTGIVRKQTKVSWWTADDKIKYSSQGGDDAWDSRFYLNIWVGSMYNLLGYSSIPGGPAEKDGVVIATNAFGTIGIGAPYNMGRTAVHEVGHWLGLKHIWGDASCGDDYVDDTPKQGTYTTGCPSGFRSSCDNGTLGDMYMNYMDFTDDACLNLFTQGQKQRMLALFADGGPRNLILSGKGLNQPWSTASDSDEHITTTPTVSRLYPNPASAQVTINFGSDKNWIGKTLTILNMNGASLLNSTINSTSQKINIAELKPGIYFIQASNGSERIRERFIKL